MSETAKTTEKEERWVRPRHRFFRALAFLPALLLTKIKCGATVVDLNQCIGCGLCTTRCEFDAIHITRDHPDASRMYTAENGKLKAILPNIAKRGLRIAARKAEEVPVIKRLKKN